MPLDRKRTSSGNLSVENDSPKDAMSPFDPSMKSTELVGNTQQSLEVQGMVDDFIRQ